MINKRAELLTVIECESPDIICITEILPKNCGGRIQPVELQLHGYDCFHNLGQEQCHRGVAIWIKNNLSAQPYKMDKRSQTARESVWCEIPLKDRDTLLVGTVYRSPNSTVENNVLVNELLARASENRTHVLVVGDFNHPQIDWKEGISPRVTDNPASKFLESVRDSFLVQHVQKPTHYRSEQTPSILDLVFSNEQAMIDSIRHEAPVGKSHHQTLLFKFRCYTEKKSHGVQRFNFAKGDYSKLRDAVSSQKLTDKMRDTDVTQAWNLVQSGVLSAMETCIPKVRSRTDRSTKPIWMNDEVMSKIKKKKQTYQKYLQTREGTDYLYYTRARNQAKNSCRVAVKNLEKTVAKNAKKNPKAFFAYARTKTKTREGVADLRDGQQKVSTDEGKAKLLNSFFSSVFTDEDTRDMPPCTRQNVESSLSDIVINKEDVYKRLQALNPNKSPGPDGFHPRVLKELAAELSEPLALVFEKSLRNGILPSDWKEAQVTPLFKKGERCSPGNYRPISLTSVVCKVMEGIVRDKVIEHLTENRLLSECQHGFVSGRSCTTNLIATLEDWTDMLDEGSAVDAIYLDFAKAFDSVPHERLLRKLEALGIEGQILQWIRDFLIGRRQRVSVNGTLSDWAAVGSGVPQGSVLGPVLFVVFINDLPECLSSLCSMYADDTKVYRRVDGPEDRNKLQSDLNGLVDWADTWQLRFNADKCKVLHLGKKNRQFEYEMRKHVSTETNRLQATELEKDLGVNMDNELKFSKHIEIQVNKANRLLGLVRRSYEYLDSEAMKLLFVALIRPHLEFGNVVWHPHLERDKKLVEGVLRRATKVIPGLKDLTYEERLKKMNIPSMTYRRTRGDLIEAYKYTHGLYTLKDRILEREERTNTRGHNYKLAKPRCNTTLRQTFFSQRIIDRWNKLPAHVAEAPSLNAFKNRIDSVMSRHMFSVEEPPTNSSSDQTDQKQSTEST